MSIDHPRYRTKYRKTRLQRTPTNRLVYIWPMSRGLAGAIGVAVVLLAIPVALAVANTRGWLPKGFWDHRYRETWLDKRPWIGSLLMSCLYITFGVLQYIEGAALWWLQLVLAVIWVPLPYVFVKARRDARNAETLGVNQSNATEERRDRPTDR